MVIQYCVDYEDFVFGEISGKSTVCPASEPKLRRELYALRQLIFLDQLGSWIYACTPSLLKELLGGEPTDIQREVYTLLLKSWRESGWNEAYPLESSEIDHIDNSLRVLNLRHSTDRRHLAEAIVLNAAWFITNDGEIIIKCKGQNLPLHVARPSECIEEISVGL